MKMVFTIAIAIICLVHLNSCVTTSFAPPPPLTADSARSIKGEHVALAMLREGRGLFVSRCIECHTLPPFWHYRAEDWSQIVDSMAQRSKLKPAERDAIVAYILTVRAQ